MTFSQLYANIAIWCLLLLIDGVEPFNRFSHVERTIYRFLSCNHSTFACRFFCLLSLVPLFSFSRLVSLPLLVASHSGFSRVFHGSSSSWSFYGRKKIWKSRDSNRWPLEWQSSVLTTRPRHSSLWSDLRVFQYLMLKLEILTGLLMFGSSTDIYTIYSDSVSIIYLIVNYGKLTAGYYSNWDPN